MTKADVRRGLIGYQLAPAKLTGVFERLRSVQYDPLSPAGCNHDLVLQARVAEYRVGDWERVAYHKRLIYDGWDKQACLIPFGGWPVRRIFHKWHAGYYERIFRDHPHAIEAVLGELTERGPLLPREFTFQEKKPEWRTSWHGPNLTKQALRSLWYAGRVMTHSRRRGHHVYDLTERLVPPALLEAPPMDESESIVGILRDRYHGVGILRPNAAWEVWSLPVPSAARFNAIEELVRHGEIVPVSIEGSLAHATPEFLATLDQRRRPARVTFLAPLDPIMWDRKMVEFLFGFEYLWEVYKPVHQRRWGYYVLPVLFGETFVARMDLFSRQGALEIRSWHWEEARLPSAFWPALTVAVRKFLDYLGADRVVVSPGVDERLAEALVEVCAVERAKMAPEAGPPASDGEGLEPDL